jgi:integrase
MGAIGCASEIWGGRQFLLIPTNGRRIEDKFWEILEAYSPDHIVTYNLNYADLEEADSQRFEAIKESNRKRFEDQAFATRFDDWFSESARFQPLDNFSIDDELQQKLIQRLSPFHFQNRAVDGFLNRQSGFTYPPRAARHEVTALSYDEARDLLRTAKDDRLYALWVVAISLGLRRSELLGLTWAGVDLDRKTLRVARGVQRVGGQLVIGELKSERSHRTLPLPEVTAEALRNHRTRQTQERLQAIYWEPNNLVFCTQLGGPIEPRNVNRSFRSLLIRSKVRVDIDRDAAGNVRFTTKLRLHDYADLRVMPTSASEAVHPMVIAAHRSA